MLAATQNKIQTNKINSKLQKRHASLIMLQLCAPTGTQVYLSMLYENIRAKNVVDDNVLPNSVCLVRK